MNAPDGPGSLEEPRRSEEPPQEDIATLAREIKRQAARSEEIWNVAPAPPERRRVKALTLAFVVLANLYVWIAQPSWLVGDGGRPPTAEAREQQLRNQMYVQALRIQAYRRENGRVPTRLEDAGEPVGSLGYLSTGATSWELLGEIEGREIRLTSSDRLVDFLGGR